MNRYGQAITWGPLSAPQLFTGDIVSYSYRDAETDEELPGVSEIAAIAFHSRKATLNFESEITKGSTDFLDLSSTAAAIAVSGIEAGTVLVSQVVEKWALNRRKSASIMATHYPDIVSSGGLANKELDAFTPDQSELGIVLPGQNLIYGTFGLTHLSGIVHELTLTQTLKITEDDPSPAGKILGAATHKYKRTLSMLLLATGEPPAVRSVLNISGAPDHALNHRITSVDLRFEREKGKMYAIEGVWIPAFEDEESDGGGDGGGGGGDTET
jgi:hypothetical protein